MRSSLRQMRSSDAAQFSHRRREPHPGAASAQILWRDAVALQRIAWRKDLAARAGHGQRPQMAGNTVSDAGVAARVGGADVDPLGEDQRGELEQRGGGLAAITLEVV